MKPLTVNEALARLPELNGSCVLLEGVLAYEYEDVAIYHWPKAEREERGSSLWLGQDGVCFDFNDEVMSRWSGKRVVVLGVIESVEESTVDGWPDGFGPYGFRLVQIRARRIDLRKRWLKEHPEFDDAAQAATRRSSNE